MKNWIQEVRRAATQGWDAEPPVLGAVVVTITYFYDRASLDVDNIPKPILDALKDLIYSDDSQVADLVCRKRDINDDLQIRNPSTALLDCLRGTGPVLHVAVARAMTQEVLF